MLEHQLSAQILGGRIACDAWGNQKAALLAFAGDGQAGKPPLPRACVRASTWSTQRERPCRDAQHD
eukprot:6210737-Pleurochrysis_carterae.AAC.2